MNGFGIDGFAAVLGEQPYRHTTVLAWLGAGIELAGGLLLIIGLLTPMAAAALLAMALNVVLLKSVNGFFDTLSSPLGFESDLALAGLAAGLVLAGGGRIAVDHFLQRFRALAVNRAEILAIAVVAAFVAFILLRD